MKLFEEITAQDMLEHLRKFIVKAMRNGDVCAAKQAATEMAIIENLSKLIAEKEGRNR